tara:strand:- start:506 stop:718 length:213 start_codon:yes stop_codon:yes gene_type:complete
MKRGEKSLEVRAKQQISICCKTLCEREVVEAYIEELECEIADLKKYVAYVTAGPAISDIADKYMEYQYNE